MEASDIRRLKDVDEGNRRLKQMYADLSLKHEALKAIVEKALRPAAKRELVDYAVEHHGLRLSAACKVLNLSRSVYQCRPKTNRDLPVIEAMQQVIDDDLGFGFPTAFKTLRRRENSKNHKRVKRFTACSGGSSAQREASSPGAFPQAMALPTVANHNWSIDFISDALTRGRRFRTTNVVDDFNREVLAMEIDLNIPAARLIREFAYLR